MRPLLIMALLCPFLNGCFQTSVASPPYAPGDAIPSFTISNIINHHDSIINISSTSSCITILNFVAISCPSCIIDYPRFDSLQKTFGDKIRIILVTSEDRKKVNSLLSTHKSAKNLNLPVAVSDTILRSWFPHRFLTHTVWIQNGIVKGITGPDQVNINNIELLLLGRSPHFNYKQDPIPYNSNEPMLLPNPELLKALPTTLTMQYSVLTPHITGISPAFRKTIDSSSNTIRISYINQSIINLYKYAYGKGKDFPASQVLLRVKNKAEFIPDSFTKQESWNQKNTYCYEASFPITLTRNQQLARMQSDLDHYLGISSSFESREVSGLKLIRSGRQTVPFRGKDTSTQKFISISNLVYHINQSWYGIPVFDETQLPAKTFLPFVPHWFTDLKSLNFYLSPYGLTLVPVKRTIPVISLTQTDNSIN